MTQIVRRRMPAALLALVCVPSLGLMMRGAEPLGSSVASSTLQAGGGVAVGTVRFLADPPEPERLRVTQNPDVCGLRKFSQEFIVSKETKGLKNVVMTIVGVPARSAPAGAPGPQVAQHVCEYEPHVQTAIVGQQLTIVNQDDVLHNIHAYGEAKQTFFNLAQPIQHMVNRQTLDTEGVVTLKCDVHNWMQAYVVVSPHPFVAVTDENGAFRIEGVPPGAYKLRAWHEALGELAKDITIAAGREAEVNFDVGQ